VGNNVGCSVEGECVGRFDGISVGRLVVGSVVGLLVLGLAEGSKEGILVGWDVVGDVLGDLVGYKVGCKMHRPHSGQTSQTYKFGVSVFTFAARCPEQNEVW